MDSPSVSSRRLTPRTVSLSSGVIKMELLLYMRCKFFTKKADDPSNCSSCLFFDINLTQLVI